MLSASRGAAAALVLAALALGGCATRQTPLPRAALASARELAPSPAGADPHQPFSYRAPDVHWSEYSRMQVLPVVLYTGADAQFDDADDEDKRAVMAAMGSFFESALRRRYTLVDQPGPQTLKLRLTLTGFEKNTPVLSTLSKVLPIGLVRNTIRSASGEQGSHSGSLSYAVEVYDASSDRLLRAFVAKRYPSAMNVGASLGTLDAARTAARDGGLALLDELR